MTTWRRVASLTPDERLDVLALLQRLDVLHGREALDEQRRRVILHAGAADHWLRIDGDQLLGYAQVQSTVLGATLEMAGGGFDDALAHDVLDCYPDLEWWLRGPEVPPTAGPVVRTLNFMTGPLRLDAPPLPDGVRVDVFDPERDSASWLAHNNEAFAAHPEQGAWAPDDLALRLRERWFDPTGFLLFRRDDDLLASCWTKIHELHPERLGEIYVIAVSPRARGLGLGRLAVCHGLASLAKRGAGRGSL